MGGRIRPEYAKELQRIIRYVSRHIENTNLTDTISMSNEFEASKKQYKKILNELEAIAKAEKLSDTDSIWKYVKDKYTKGSLVLKRQVLESKKDTIMVGMAEDLLLNQTEYFSNEVVAYKKELEIIKQYNSDYSVLEKEVEVRKEKIKRIENDISKMRGNLKEMTRTYHGIEKLQEKEGKWC